MLRVASISDHPTPPPDIERTRGRRRWIAMAVSAALLIGVTAAVLASTSTHSNDGATGRLLPSTPTSLPSFDPATFRQLLAQLRGEPVVVNFWGSWWGPCINESPVLPTAPRRHRYRVHFIGLKVLARRA